MNSGLMKEKKIWQDIPIQRKFCGCHVYINIRENVGYTRHRTKTNKIKTQHIKLSK
jgi:hypothetical protein